MIKKLAKWFFCDPIVVAFMAASLVWFLLLVCLLEGRIDEVTKESLGSVSYKVRSVVYEQPIGRLLFQLNTPALIIRSQWRQNIDGASYLAPMSYLFMVIIPAFLYGIVGKIVSGLYRSDWVALIFMMTGFVLFSLSIAYRVIPLAEIDYNVRNTFFAAFLAYVNLPTWLIVFWFLGIFRETPFVAVLFYPFGFIVQIVLFWIIAKVMGLLCRAVRGTFFYIFKGFGKLPKRA